MPLSRIPKVSYRRPSTGLSLIHIYLQNGGESSIFNLGNGVGFTVKEVIDTAREVTGHPIPAVESPRRAGDPAQLVASSEKARTVLGLSLIHIFLLLFGEKVGFGQPGG